MSVVDMIRNGQVKSFTAVQAKVLLDQLPNDKDVSNVVSRFCCLTHVYM